MAGSFGHVRPGYGGIQLIEHMGDGAECIEQLLWLVLYFGHIATKQNTVEEVTKSAETVLDYIFYPQVRGEQPKDIWMLAVDKVMENEHLDEPEQE